MRIAALVLCHIFPERINRLISSLDDEDIDVYIHIDKKSTLFDEIKSDNGKINILCDELRVDVRWGQFSQVEAELNLLRYASGRNSYDYYLLLSGMDYPLVSTEELKLFLSDNAERNYINLCNSRNNNNNGKSNNHDKCNDIYYLSCLLNKHGISRILRKFGSHQPGGTIIHLRPSGARTIPDLNSIMVPNGGACQEILYNGCWNISKRIRSMLLFFETVETLMSLSFRHCL